MSTSRAEDREFAEVGRTIGLIGLVAVCSIVLLIVNMVRGPQNDHLRHAWNIALIVLNAGANSGILIWFFGRRVARTKLRGKSSR